MGRDTAIRVPVIGEDLRGIKTSINRRGAKDCAEHGDVARELEAVLNTQTEQAGPSILDNIAEAGRFGEEPAEKEGDYDLDHRLNGDGQKELSLQLGIVVSRADR